jgi:hypothetical protein
MGGDFSKKKLASFILTPDTTRWCEEQFLNLGTGISRRLEITLIARVIPGGKIVF